MSELLPMPSGGRRNLRLLLFVIILATAPLYCIGFILWGVAPGARPPATATATASPTLRPATLTPTRTSAPFRSVIVTATRPLPPTPRQFRPPVQQQPVQQPVQQPPPQPVPQPGQDGAPQPLPVPVGPADAEPDTTPVVTPTVVPIQQFDDDE